MKKIVVLFLLTSTFISYKSFAQGPAAAPAQISLDQAKALVEAAVSSAKSANANVSIAVVDVNGDLVCFYRMDGAISIAVTSSQGKARTAILFGQPTKAVADAVGDGKAISSTLTPSGAGTFAIMVQQGGLPIIKNGKIIGGIGVGGSSPANDESFAKAALETVK